MRRQEALSPCGLIWPNETPSHGDDSGASPAEDRRGEAEVLADDEVVIVEAVPVSWLFPGFSEVGDILLAGEDRGGLSRPSPSLDQDLRCLAADHQNKSSCQNAKQESAPECLVCNRLSRALGSESIERKVRGFVGLWGSFFVSVGLKGP